MVVLGFRVDAGRRDALHVADPQVQAALALRLVRDPDIGNREGIELVDSLPRVARAPGRLAAGHDHFHVGAAQPGQADAAFEHRGDLVRGLARVQAKARATGEEAVQVRIEAEEGPFPDGDDVVGGVGTQETPIGQGDAGLGDGKVVAAHEGGAPGEVGGWLLHAPILAGSRRAAKPGCERRAARRQPVSRPCGDACRRSSCCGWPCPAPG